MKKKVAEIKDVLYGEGDISCEPAKEEIEKAILEKDFEMRSFQGDIEELKTEFKNSGVECYAQIKRYHKRRIAYLAVKGCKDPILLCKDECTILDGLHRLKAAKHIVLKEIDVIVTDAPLDLSDVQKDKLWAAIKVYGSIDKALYEAGINILRK